MRSPFRSVLPVLILCFCTPAVAQEAALQTHPETDLEAAAVASGVTTRGKTISQSTRDKSLAARQRDRTRLEQGKIGRSKHKTEMLARQWRQRWRGGQIDPDSVSADEFRDVQFPYGPVNLSKFPTNDPAPKVSTQAKHYTAGGKPQPVGHRYADLVAVLSPAQQQTLKRKRDRDVASELLSVIESGERPPAGKQVIRDGAEANAANKLLAIGMVSEPLRVQGTSKGLRAVLRRVERGDVSLDEAFTGDEPQFGMAKNPKTERERQNEEGRNFRRPIPRPGWVSDDEDFSDDSDDEDPTPPAAPRIKRVRRTEPDDADPF